MGNTSQKPAVLFVEDDADISVLYQMRMEAEGMAVTMCEDGAKALAAGKSVKPALILLDLMLPNVDGFTLLGQFRDARETAEAKIIVMSAIGEKTEIERALSLGASEFIVKSQKSISQVMETLKAELGVPPPTAS
jgi:DNA-binding response OmpR family regulator